MRARSPAARTPAEGQLVGTLIPHYLACKFLYLE